MQKAVLHIEELSADCLKSIPAAAEESAAPVIICADADADSEELSSDCLQSIPVAAPDRRRHPRFLLSLHITMEGDNNFYTGLSEDLSEGGVFIATHHVLPIGTSVVVSFTLPKSHAEVRVHGVVRWLRGVDAMFDARTMFQTAHDHAHVKAGMGIQFTNVAPESILAILDFMRYRRPEFFDA